MFITLNPESDVPVFQQIHDEIVLAIAHGQLSDGDKLDPRPPRCQGYRH